MKRTTVVAVAAGVVLGVVATPSHAPKETVKFKFIHGPTKYITKTVPEKVVTQPPIVMEWPASCKNALTFMKQGAKESNTLYNNTKIYFDYVDKLQRSQLDDPISLSEVAVWLSDHKAKVRSDMQTLSYSTQDLEIALEACQKAVDKAEEDAQNAASGDG